MATSKGSSRKTKMGTFLNVEKEGVRVEDPEDRVRWRRTIGFGKREQ